MKLSREAVLKIADLSRLELSTEEVEKFAYDYLEGHLDHKTTQLVDRHLKRCKNCQRFMNSYRKIRELGTRSKSPPLDPEFTRELSVFLRKKG